MTIYDAFNQCTYDFELLSVVEKQIVLHNQPFRCVHKNFHNPEDEVFQLNIGACLVCLGANQWALCKTFHESLDIRTNLMCVYEEKWVFFVKCNEMEIIESFCARHSMELVNGFGGFLFYIPTINQYLIKDPFGSSAALADHEFDAIIIYNRLFKTIFDDEDEYYDS